MRNHLIVLWWKVKDNILKPRFLQHILSSALLQGISLKNKTTWRNKSVQLRLTWIQGFFPSVDNLKTIVLQNSVLILTDYWYWCYMSGACPSSWWCRGSKNTITALQQNCPFPQKEPFRKPKQHQFQQQGDSSKRRRMISGSHLQKPTQKCSPESFRPHKPLTGPRRP